MAHGIEEPLNVRVEHPVHLPPRETRRQRVQRIVRSTPRTEPVRQAQEFFLPDRTQHGHHGLLDDLVLQSRNAQRSHPPVGLRDEDPPGRQRPISSRVDPPVQVREAFRKVGFVLLPRHPINAGSGSPFQGEEARGHQRDRDVMQQGGELRLLIPPCDFPHTIQVGRRETPALRPARGFPGRVPLGGRPSLPHLRGCSQPTLVRRVHRYYAALRRPDPVRARRAACGLLSPTRGARGWGRDLPVPE